MIHYFFIFLLALLASTPETSFKKPSSKSPFFTLVRAEKIPWQSGVAEGKGGSGITYNVLLTFKKDFKGYFNIIWIGRHYYTAKVLKKEANPNLNDFKAGETITVQVTEFIRYPIGERPLVKNDTDPPFDYTGECLLEYVSGSTTYCYVIKKFVSSSSVNGI